MKSKNTKRQTNNPDDDDIRPEYNLEGIKGERGKYYKRLIAAGYLPVLLPPDVAQVFKDEEAVTAALRGLIDYSRKAIELNDKSKRRPKTSAAVAGAGKE